MPDPLPWGSYLRPAGAAADHRLPGPHPAPAAGRPPGAGKLLGGHAAAGRPAALSGDPDGNAPGGPVVRGRGHPVRRPYPSPGAQPGLLLPAAPGRPVRSPKGPGSGGPPPGLETAPAGGEPGGGRPHRRPRGCLRPGPAGDQGGLFGGYRPLSRPGGRRPGRRPADLRRHLRRRGRRLWLAHYSPRIEDPEAALPLAQAVFPAAECGFDGKSVTLPFTES